MNIRSSVFITNFILVFLLLGCASTQPDVMSYLDKSINEHRWRSAFLHYTLIFQTGSEAEVAIASNKVINNPEIIKSGTKIFTPIALKNQIETSNLITNDMRIEANALCSLISPSQCAAVRNNLEVAENLIDKNKANLTKLILVQSAFDKLHKKDKEQLEQKYNLSFYANDEIGFITERQVENVSTAGSTAGSDSGSALASVAYINNALNTGSYNVWTDISVAVAGAAVGSGVNKAPVKKYIIKYTVRDLNNQIKSVTVSQGSPIGESVGLCYGLTKKAVIDSDFCTMTSDEIRTKYLTK
jgi:outer membrane lipoprotein SlyB